MNRALLNFAKYISVALIATSTLAIASEEKSGAKADAAKGATLYSGGDPARGVMACVACHGVAGNSTVSVNPKLAAQHAAYTQKQLHEFKGPTRNHVVMTGIAKAMTDEDIANVAAYLDQQKVLPGSAGIGEKNVPACAGCHGPNGAGIPAQFARIGGQHQDYTVAQLTNFRAGTRSNNAQMTTIAKRLSEDEIQAVADYIAGLNSGK